MTDRPPKTQAGRNEARHQPGPPRCAPACAWRDVCRRTDGTFYCRRCGGPLGLAFTTNLARALIRRWRAHDNKK